MTRERFNQIASSWDDDPLRLKLAAGVARSILTSLHLSESMKALEIGCGTGLVTTTLAEKLGSIDAVDSSEGMLSVLKNKIATKGLVNIRTFHGDFSEALIGSLSGKYDLVYSSMTLHHILDIDDFLAKCRSLLKPGGIIAIADLELEDGSFHGDMPGIEHFGFDPEKLANRLMQNGLVKTSCKSIHVISKNDSQGALRKYPVFLLTGTKQTIS